MNARSKLFWAIWLVIVISVLWWLSHLAAYGSQHRRSAKPITQGLGAEDLISNWDNRVTVTMPPPTPSGIPRNPRNYFFAATATDATGSESDFSNECVFTNTSGSNITITLAWDASPSQGITNYTIYKGTNSGQYFARYYAQTHLSLTMPIGGFQLSNVVITVSALDSDFILFNDGIGTQWFGMPTNYWRATNPPAPRFFRALGNNQGSKVNINVIRQ